MTTTECLCPRTPAGEVRHPDGDTVTLRDPLDFRSAVTMQKSVTVLYSENENATTAEVLAVLAEAYLLHGVTSWTVVDAKGKPVPANPTTVAEYLLPNVTAAMAVADEADGIYAKAVLLPLLARASNSSPPTPTTELTSAGTGSPPEPLRPSKRSSTTTSRTAATGTTSTPPAGDSSSSQSSASAA